MVVPLHTVCTLHTDFLRIVVMLKMEYPSRYLNAASLVVGGRNDICSHSKPCMNDGSCSQISSGPGFKCRCEGTGFYGTYCETR